MAEQRRKRVWLFAIPQVYPGRRVASGVGESFGKIIDFQTATVENFETNPSPFLQFLRGQVFREIRRTCQVIYLTDSVGEARPKEAA